MAQTAERILPGAGLDAAAELLKTDPNRCVVGGEALGQSAFTFKNGVPEDTSSRIAQSKSKLDSLFKKK